jgi:hypothetical protein
MRVLIAAHRSEMALVEELLRVLVGAAGCVLLFVVLLDAFETVILPRRVTRDFRLARFFTRKMWATWSSLGRHIHTLKSRETYLSYYGPFALISLFTLWAWTLVLAFAMLHWAGGSAVSPPGTSYAGNFRSDLYLSGSTFFTLGLGDAVPHTRLERFLTVIEAGTGFGFLAIVLSYLPTLYGAFSQREVNISLLDARAGSPPTAGELLRRHGRQRIMDGLGHYLKDWETWSAQLMESHLTYPILCFFRSQHANQSWLAAFAAVLDMCALLIAYGDGEVKWQAKLTFVTARHAVADLSEVLRANPQPPTHDRLPPADLARVRALLMQCGLPPCSEAADAKLNELRRLYEPQLNGLSTRLHMPLPSWGAHPAENRPHTVWARISSDTTALEPAPMSQDDEGDHF